jgi:hypothetical protein
MCPRLATLEIRSFSSSVAPNCPHYLWQETLGHFFYPCIISWPWGILDGKAVYDKYGPQLFLYSVQNVNSTTYNTKCINFSTFITDKQTDVKNIFLPSSAITIAKKS